MSFINVLQNRKDLTSEQKRVEAERHIQELKTMQGGYEIGSAQFNALPKYQRRRILNLQREINSIRGVGTWFDDPRRYKQSKKIVAPKAPTKPTTKQQRRETAKKKVGHIKRIETDPRTGEVTYIGQRGKFTFPSASKKAFTGRDRPGGLQSAETYVYVRQPDGTTIAMTRNQLESQQGKEFVSKLKQTGAKLDFRIDTSKEKEIIFYKDELSKAKRRQYERIVEGKERPAEKAARLAVLAQGREDTDFGRFAERNRQALLAVSGEEARLAHYPQTFVGTQYGTVALGSQVYGDEYAYAAHQERLRQNINNISDFFGNFGSNLNSKSPGLFSFPISSSAVLGKEKVSTKEEGFNPLENSFFSLSKTLFVEGDKEGTYEDRIMKFGGAQQSYRENVYGGIDWAASWVTFGSGRPMEERGFFGSNVQQAVQIIPSIGAYFIELGLTTPRKAQLAGEGLGYKKYRGSVLDELGAAVPRAALTVPQMLDITKPGGVANVAFVMGGSLLKARADFRAGKVGPAKGKTVIDIKTKTYTNPVLEFEKLTSVAKKSNIASVKKIDLLMRKEGGIKFTYPRTQIPVSSVGKSAPAVSISTGTVRRGGMLYEYRGTQVGRKVYGSLKDITFRDSPTLSKISKAIDIVYKKTPEGKLEVTYLKQEMLEPRFMREFKSQISTKSLLNLNLEKSIIQQKVKVNYATEKIKFDIEKTTTLIQKSGKQFDVGKKYMDEVYFDLRSINKQIKIDVVGKDVTSDMLREIKKTFSGTATSEVFQIDKAGLQTEIVKVGESMTITKLPTDIEYAMNPKNLPSTKLYKTDYKVGGVEAISESIKRAMMVTQRELKFTSESKYLYSEKYNPLKKYWPEAMLESKRAMLGKTELGKPVKIQAKIPELFARETGLKPSISIKNIKGMTSFKSGKFITPSIKLPSQSVSIPEAKTITSNINNVKNYQSNYVKSVNKILNKNKNYIQNKNTNISKNINKAINKTVGKSIGKSLGKSMTRSISKTIQKTITKSMAATSIPTRTHRTRIRIPPPPPPPKIIIPGLPKLVPGLYKPKKTKKKKKYLSGQYAPSLVAFEFNIKVPKVPKLKGLSGLEIRPIKI